VRVGATRAVREHGHLLRPPRQSGTQLRRSQSAARLSAVATTASWRRYGQVFDGVAEAYDEVRPGYPPELVEEALKKGELGRGSRILEVGCGTGKLTELLIGRGYAIDAVEPGPRMIEAARRRIGSFPDVTFHLGRFEDADLPADTFAAVFSASAFHWVDPAIGWTKVASHLRPGGLLALLAYMEVWNELSAEVDSAFRAALLAHVPELGELPPPRDLKTLVAGAEQRRDNVSEVWDWLMGAGFHGMTRPEAADRFEEVKVSSTVSISEETADSMLAVFRTTSVYPRIQPEQRPAFEHEVREIVERHGGTIPSSLANVLVTARRAGFGIG
jgi:SAM-dependent methyltransferase